MTTLIVPAAGKSSRFPNMKPKWMLTHPDGELMIQKALSGLNLEIFDRVIITIVKAHAEAHDADLILSQVFADMPKIEVCVLDDFTKSASETVFLTLEKMAVAGSFVVKDSDNGVTVRLPLEIQNGIVGYDLHVHPNISNIPGKSFLLVNEQNIVQDIIEKKVVSNIICLGIYCFETVENFKQAYLDLLDKGVAGEMFVSHVISYMLSKHNTVFTCVMADGYDDWGTLTEWQAVQKRYRTYFVDVDGVLLKNCGQYGRVTWRNNRETIPENIATLVQLQKEGAQIIITTSRPEACRDGLEKILLEAGLKPYAILMGMHHAARVIVNDFAATNPYPSAMAISIPRNSLIKDYM